MFISSDFTSSTINLHTQKLRSAYRRLTAWMSGTLHIGNSVILICCWVSLSLTLSCSLKSQSCCKQYGSDRSTPSTLHKHLGTLECPVLYCSAQVGWGTEVAVSPGIWGTATSVAGLTGFDDAAVAAGGVARAGEGVDFGAWISMGRISVLSSLVFFCFGSGAFSFSWT